MGLRTACNGAQLETVIDRALSLATSAPEGPVYLSLPREVLAERLPGFVFDSPSRRVAASSPGADEGALEEAAAILSQAKRPVIITASTGRDPAAVAALSAFAEAFAIPVVEHRQRHLSLSAEHPCHLGYDPTPFVKEADAILVLEMDVPWVPLWVQPPADCRVIHLGVDPLCARYPIRGFPCDVAIVGAARLALPKLGAAVSVAEGVVAERRQALAERRTAQRLGWQKLREEMATQTPIHPSWVSHCLFEARAKSPILHQRIHVAARALPLDRAGLVFRVEPGGRARLGRRRGASGWKLARPERQADRDPRRRRSAIFSNLVSAGAPRLDHAPSSRC